MKPEHWTKDEIIVADESSECGLNSWPDSSVD